MAQQKVLEAASIHFTHFHGDLDTKFDGLMDGGLETVRRDATQTAEENARKERKAALQEMVQAWGDRLESQLRTLAKS